MPRDNEDQRARMTGHSPHPGYDRPGDKDIHEQPAVNAGPHEHRWQGDRCEVCGLGRDITSPPLPGRHRPRPRG